MKAPSAIVCPACGTKNRPKWEFCVSCGESLKGVAAETLVQAAVAEPVAAAEPGGAGALSWLTTIVGVGLAVAAFLYLRGRQSEARGGPDPALFTVPSTERSPGAAPAEPRGSIANPATQSELSRAEALLASGDAAAALPILAELVGQLPDDPKAHYLYASALWHTGSTEEAIPEYRRAIDLDSSNRLFRSDLAKGLASLGRREEAMVEYEAILTTDPNSPGVLRELAALHAQAGNRERWLDLLTRAAEVEPSSAIIRQDLAYALEKSGRTSEAIDAYRQVVSLEPKAATSRGLLADLLYRQGRADEAIAVVQEGIQLDPNAARPHRDLASLYERTGRVAEAVAEYREYARLAPTSPDARQLAERAERLERAGGGGA
jgi:Flp pilus assembly protein TadD